MVWVSLILLLVFLVLAVVFSLGKGHVLIAGYNTMSEADKERYDAEALAKFMGKSMYGFAGLTGLWILADVYSLDWLFHVGTGLMVVLTFGMVIYANTGDRFKRE